ncbi:MAG TPA: nucleotidyltransferase domain-containing protein [Desulfuromonadales bacterium]|nr:nucleotidyltransferase domain-containing protein [Desulfuromonadales bacterium]
MSLKILDRSRPRTSLLDFTPAEIRSFLQKKLADKGVLEAYLFGSFASGSCNPWSDLDVVAVKPTDQPFVERPREFSELYELGIPIDILVYTPLEFEEIRACASPFWQKFERQKVRIL